MNTMRLQAVMAHAGVAARRKCEDLIRQGKVLVNGQLAHIGMSVRVGVDAIMVNGRPIQIADSFVYIVLHKPKGYITTVTDLYNRKTIMDLIGDIGEGRRLYPVGRLDRDAEGILLLTDDGAFAHKVMHPSSSIPKTYQVILDKPLHSSDKKALERGVQLDDGPVRDIRITLISKSCVNIRIVVGRNKIVKRLFNHFGYRVERLKRISIGTLQLGSLGLGKMRQLTREQAYRIVSSVQSRESTSQPRRLRSTARGT